MDIEMQSILHRSLGERVNSLDSRLSELQLAVYKMSTPKYLQPQLKIKLDYDFCMPERAHPNDAGADLVAKEDTLLTKGERTLVKTGVYIEIPVGYVGLLFPRSSLSKRNITMTNSVGVIDSDYRGEIMASLMSHGEFYAGDLISHYHIEKGTKIVQLVIVPIILSTFKVVDKLEDTVRGTGGFGSTG